VSFITDNASALRFGKAEILPLTLNNRVAVNERQLFVVCVEACAQACGMNANVLLRAPKTVLDKLQGGETVSMREVVEAFVYAFPFFAAMIDSLDSVPQPLSRNNMNREECFLAHLRRRIKQFHDCVLPKVRVAKVKPWYDDSMYLNLPQIQVALDPTLASMFSEFGMGGEKLDDEAEDELLNQGIAPTQEPTSPAVL
jgi:hypothetical protein